MDQYSEMDRYNQTTVGDGRNKSYASTDNLDRGPIQAATPINREYSELDAVLSELQCRLGDLTMKLSPVLGPEQPERGNEQQKQPEPLLSPLGENLRNDRRRVTTMIYNVQNLLDRVEI